MKINKPSLTHFVSALASLLLLPGTLLADAGERNLLSPTEWKPREPWQKKGEHWDQQEDANRGAFLRLMKRPVVLEQDVQTDGSIAKVRLAADIRIQNLRKAGQWGTGSIAFQCLDADGKPIKGAGTRRFFHSNTDWSSFDREGEIPAGTQTIRVIMEYRADGGTVDFSNLTLTPTELREAPKREPEAAIDAPAIRDVKVEYAEHAEWHKDPPQKPMEQWQADLDPTAYRQTVYVAPGGAGDGSAEDKALGSIKTALDKAGELIRDGVPTRVLLADGDYRESWFALDGEQLGGKAKETLLVIEGASREGVRILGSRTIGFEPENWERVDAARNIYRLPWTHTELPAVPRDAWNPAIDPISRHRVMVFVNGGWLRPVQLEQYRHEKKEEKYEREHGGISTRRWVTDIYTGFAGLDKLEPGTMAVNTLSPGENEFDQHPHDHPNSLLIRLPDGVDFDPALVEVAYGTPGGFRIDNKDNFALRNLTIQHMGIAAIRIRNANNVLTENFEVSHGDGGGGAAAISFAPVTHLTLRNGKVHHNGMFGALVNAKFATVENLTVTENNWRGGLSDSVMHGQGGMGTHFSHMIIRNSRFNHNYGSGLRQDVLGEHVLIENCQFNFNQRLGMFWEISYGPVTIRNSEVIGNLGYGIHILNQHGLTFDNVTVVNNRGSQFSIFGMLNRGKIIHKGSPRFSGPKRWPLDGELHEGYWIEGILAMKIHNCTIAVTDPSLASTPLVGAKYWSGDRHYYFDWMVNQLAANNNVYWHVATDRVFDIGQGKELGTFAHWREVTGEDGDSAWKKPETDFPAAVAPALTAEAALQLHRE